MEKTTTHSNTDTYEAINKIIQEYKGRDLNEADTRHKIIDAVIHDHLSWPKNRVKLEEYIQPGYADYVLTKSNGDFLLFIEAKKQGTYFTLPSPYDANNLSCFISMSKLFSTPAIKEAINQVRAYCLESGCEYACITNGHEWIFFKTFEKGKRFENLQAFVIRSLEFFTEEYTKSRNYFSFTQILENASLSSLLTSTPPKDRSIFIPKEKIASYSYSINSNKLASSLRPIINRYFGVINDNDTEFMERCYVAQRDYETTHAGIRNLIRDSISPHFEDYGVTQLEDTGKGGQLGGRITKNLKNKRGGEVLVLFGGKGSGKSTFIKRVLHHNPPRWLREYALVSIVDLLKVPDSAEEIRQTIWSSLVQSLDIENLLGSERDNLLSILFHDRFLVAKRQNLSGLGLQSEAYNIKLNELVAEWKKDKVYCAEQLVKYWNSKGKGVIVVVDNTDQYSSNSQDFCFSCAQEISNKLNCVVLIPMREERFHNSKIHGVLDAYDNSGFHISSPKPSEVFKKRLEYTIDLINKDKIKLPNSSGNDLKADCSLYLSILSKDFSNDASPLNIFLTACAHGDIRLSLDIFSNFLVSGYTNVDEMLAANSWTFKIHQVIKPVMIPSRYFYEESLSAIPNIFQLRSSRQSSHFTGLRILRKLIKNIANTARSYYSVAELKTYFVETFNMAEDFNRNMDILLKHGFIESNNRLDDFSEAVDSVIITNYGVYMFNELAYQFTYLDLISSDCGIFCERTSNYLIQAAQEEYKLFNKGERLERIKVRLNRAEEFIKYLSSEEKREREFYSLGMSDNEMFTYKLHQSFAIEKESVLKSASKRSNLKRRQYRAVENPNVLGQRAKVR